MAAFVKVSEYLYIGNAADTKPTGVPLPTICRELDTMTEYATKDGTNWTAWETIGSSGYTTPAHTAPTVGAATTAVLASNTSRLYALVINDSDAVIYIKLGAAAVMNEGIRLNASGGAYEMSKKLGNLYTGAINGICAAGGKVALVTEGV